MSRLHVSARHFELITFANGNHGLRLVEINDAKEQAVVLFPRSSSLLLASFMKGSIGIVCTFFIDNTRDKLEGKGRMDAIATTLAEA